MRILGVFIVSVLLITSAWNKYITGGGLVDYYDKNPKAASAPMVLFYLGKGYEVVSSYDKMLAIYGRVAARYPESPYAMEAHFGEALAMERLGRYQDAIARYQEFLEKYPNSTYARSVRNNIDILKSR